MSKGDHSPSRYRSIARESKSASSSPRDLAKRARAITDPYYESLALFTISLQKNIEETEARSYAQESIALIRQEKREWRRAELLTKLSKMAAKYPHDKEWIQLSFINEIKKLKDGKARKEALSGCISFIGCAHSNAVMDMALSNSGYEMDTIKPVIKMWASDCMDEGNPIDTIKGLEPGLMKVKLLGYSHYQLALNGRFTLDVLEKAFDIANELSMKERQEGVRYLMDRANSLEELEYLALRLTEMESTEEEAKAFASLAGRADKLNHKDLARDWFLTAMDLAKDLENGQKAVPLMNIGTGLGKMKEKDLANEAFHMALEDAGGNVRLQARIKERMGEDGPQPEISKKKADRDPVKRNVLGLYDAYEGGLKAVHLRMIARAAPLCVAYDLDLALFGFPESDLAKIIDRTIADTNIGSGGKYLRDMHTQNRIRMVNCSSKEPPGKEDWQEIGLPVATTSKPQSDKSYTLDQALLYSKENHPLKRICLIMGLGKKGLPRSLLDSVDHHLELTGRNIPLETSTAMGIIAMKLGSTGD